MSSRRRTPSLSTAMKTGTSGVGSSAGRFSTSCEPITMFTPRLGDAQLTGLVARSLDLAIEHFSSQCELQGASLVFERFSSLLCSIFGSFPGKLCLR